MKKLKDEAKRNHRLLDVTEGRRTRSMIILDSNHVVLSSVQPETIMQRFAPASVQQSMSVEDIQGIMSKGNLFIISAPSGAGKTTILKRVISDMDDVGFSVSHTTREPRPDELSGKDYYFVKPVVFKAMQEQNEFLEYAEVHGNMYGTSRAVVDNLVKEGKDVVLDIDVQGARQIMDILGDKGVYIFIAPPSLQELKKRLAKRGTESESAIATRLKNAEDEMKSLEIYDYVIINEQLDQAVEELKSIIVVERGRLNPTLS